MEDAKQVGRRVVHEQFRSERGAAELLARAYGALGRAQQRDPIATDTVQTRLQPRLASGAFQEVK